MVNRRELLRRGAATVGVFSAGCVDTAISGAAVEDPAEPPTGEATEPSRTAAEPAPTVRAPAESVTVAFIGDQGLKETSRAVLRLIKTEGTDLVVHSGDFDYRDDPEAWASMLNVELGVDFPYLASIGCHDKQRWPEYEQVLRNRVARTEGLEYTGDLGMQSTCTYKGVTVILSSAGICKLPDGIEANPTVCEPYTGYDPVGYVEEQLARANTMWRVCSWHRANHAYQVGDKRTAVPLALYDACREGGAIIATGHNHAYARTYPMADFAGRTVASRSPPYMVGDGASFALVSGIAGEEFYPTTDMVDASWWAATYTADDDGHTFGAFFTTFRPDGTGECYFKNIDGVVVDGPFGIESAYATDAAVRTPTETTGSVAGG